MTEHSKVFPGATLDQFEDTKGNAKKAAGGRDKAIKIKFEATDTGVTVHVTGTTSEYASKIFNFYDCTVRNRSHTHTYPSTRMMYFSREKEAAKEAARRAHANVDGFAIELECIEGDTTVTVTCLDAQQVSVFALFGKVAVKAALTSTSKLYPSSLKSKLCEMKDEVIEKAVVHEGETRVTITFDDVPPTSSSDTSNVQVTVSGTNAQVELAFALCDEQVNLFSKPTDPQLPTLSPSDSPPEAKHSKSFLRATLEQFDGTKGDARAASNLNTTTQIKFEATDTGVTVHVIGTTSESASKVFNFYDGIIVCYRVHTRTYPKTRMKCFSCEKEAAKTTAKHANANVDGFAIELDCIEGDTTVTLFCSDVQSVAVFAFLTDIAVKAALPPAAEDFGPSADEESYFFKAASMYEFNADMLDSICLAHKCTSRVVKEDRGIVVTFKGGTRVQAMKRLKEEIPIARKNEELRGYALIVVTHSSTFPVHPRSFEVRIEAATATAPCSQFESKPVIVIETVESSAGSTKLTVTGTVRQVSRVFEYFGNTLDFRVKRLGRKAMYTH